MKAYGEEEVTPKFLTSAPDGIQWWASLPDRFTPRKEPLAPIGEDAQWDPERVWTLWYKEKSLVSAGNQPSDVQS
jgi:hypothetical protein